MGTIAFSLGEGYAIYRIVMSHTPTHTEVNVRTSIIDPAFLKVDATIPTSQLSRQSLRVDQGSSCQVTA